MISSLNSFSEIWIRHMTSATLQGSLLAVALLAAAWILRRRSPAMRHALLMIALIKFAVPPTLTLPLGIFYHIRPIPSYESSSPVRYVAPIIDEVLVTEELPPGVNREPIPGSGQAADLPKMIPCHAPFIPRPVLSGITWLMLLHFAGALLILAFFIDQKVRLRRLAEGAARATDPDLCDTYESLCTALRLRHRPLLLVSNRNHSPMTFGAWRPAIVIPVDLIRQLQIHELRVILGHELAHHRRRDMWLGWLQLPITMIWWFNPVFWLLLQVMRSVREDCCDDLVVSAGFATGESYCRTLLQAARVASGKLFSGAAFAYIGESQTLRRRLQRIMGKKLTAPRLAWSGILVVILLAFLLLPGIRKRIIPLSGNEPVAEKGERLSDVLPSKAIPAAAVSNVAGIPSEAAQSPVLVIHVVEASTGRAIEGAALLVGLSTALREMRDVDAPHTDSNGNCTIPAPSVPFNIVARADAYVPRRLTIKTADDYPADYTFKLEKGSFIGGYVRDEAGKPVPNVKLKISSSNKAIEASSRFREQEDFYSQVNAQTDSSGRWTASGVMPNPEQIHLTLDHPNYGTTEFSTNQDSASSPMRSKVLRPVGTVSMDDLKAGNAVLVIESGLVVFGVVVDAYGKGIGGSELSQFEKNPPGGVYYLARATTRTEADGRFLFRSLEPGDIVIAVQAKGFAPEYRTVAVVPNLPAIEFRLKKGEVVRGRVVDDSGDPVAGATVQTVGGGADQPISWKGNTDADGSFLWDSAPLEPLSYRVRAEGYKPIDPVILDSSKEHEIRLMKGAEIEVSGKVIDSQTRAQVESFKVSALMNNGPMASKSVNGQNGEFALTLPFTRDNTTYTLLVEAEGYIPDGSQTIDDKHGNRSLEIVLVKGSGPSGTVTLPDGSPVSGANVFACGGGNLTMANRPLLPSILNNIRSIHCTNASRDMYTAAAVTDSSGKFALSAIAQAHSVYATHEMGFAALTADRLPASSTIVLQPWGKVEGIVMIGSKPGKGETVDILQLSATARPPALTVYFRTISDSEGKFSFPTLPDGEYLVSNRTGAGRTGQTANANVRSGETVSVKVGGAGRPLIGRLIVTGADGSSLLKIRTPVLTLKPSASAGQMPMDAAAYRDWVEREDVRAQQRAARTYSLLVEADGAFRVEDIPAGTYTLTVTVDQPISEPRPTTPAERFTTEIVVPEMPGGRSDTPLDLGVLRFQSSRK